MVDTFRGSSWPLATKVSRLPWKHGGALAKCWTDAIRLALYYGRFWPSRVVSQLCVALVALVLRDVIEPPKLVTLYAGLEPYYPLSTLDSEVRPAAFKA